MRALFCRALALALVAFSTPSRAEEPTRVWLDWSPGAGTETCLAPDAIEREVEALLGRSVFVSRGEADRTLHVDVTHEREPSRYGAHMVLRAKTGRSLGTREFVIETSACRDASEALVLAVSLLAELPRTEEESVATTLTPAATPTPSTAPTPATTSAPTPAKTPTTAPRAKRPSPWRMQARLGPAVAVDGSGALSAGALVSTMLSPPDVWPFSVIATSRLRWSSPMPEARYVLSSTALSAALCVPPQRQDHGRMTLTACAGPQATLHVGSGSGFGVDRTSMQMTFGGELHAIGDYALTPSLRLFVMLGLAASPRQVEVVVRDAAGAPRRIGVASHVTATSSIGLAFEIF